MNQEQNNTQPQTALLRSASRVDAPVKNSLCCAAAGIIAPFTATSNVLIPPEKLREAATPDATLIAQTRPPAQPVEGYKPLPRDQDASKQTAASAAQIEEEE